jgi:hypothetical protein
MMEVAMDTILTASWSAQLPGRTIAVGISRGVPRGRGGFRRVPELFPGPWFRSVDPTTYLRRYAEILARLDPVAVRDRLLAFGGTPVLLCFERADDIQAGRRYCHRHLVAKWLEDTLGIAVPEMGHPRLDRFAHLRALGIAPPRFRGRSAASGPGDKPTNSKAKQRGAT